MNTNAPDTDKPKNADEKWTYEAPVIRSGEAFETVLLNSGCNFNFNIAFGCTEPQENC